MMSTSFFSSNIQSTLKQCATLLIKFAVLALYCHQQDILYNGFKHDWQYKVASINGNILIHNYLKEK